MEIAMTKVFVYDEQTITFESHKLTRWSEHKKLLVTIFKQKVITLEYYVGNLLTNIANATCNYPLTCQRINYP